MILPAQLASVTPHDNREVGAAREDKVTLAPRLARRPLGGGKAVDAAVMAARLYSQGCRRVLVGLQARLGDDLPRGRIEEQAATPLGATPDLLAQRQQAPDEVVQAHHDPVLRRCGLDIAHLTHRSRASGVAASSTWGCSLAASRTTTQPSRSAAHTLRPTRTAQRTCASKELCGAERLAAARRRRVVPPPPPPPPPPLGLASAAKPPAGGGLAAPRRAVLTRRGLPVALLPAALEGRRGGADT
eukprot:scaffold31179_cov63-Phaeocystis_antarctica.AAC.7